MDRISNECLAIIVAYLSDIIALAPVATVSRRWQYIVEARTFASLTITSDDVRSFSDIFAGGRRRGILRQLHFAALLPAYSDDAIDRCENREEHLANIRALSDAISKLFGELSKWEGDVHGLDSTKSRRQFKIVVDTWSPIDYGRRRRASLGYGIGPARSKGRYLTLDLEPTALPHVPLVTQFGISVGRGRAVIPTVVTQLLGAMPSVESTSVEILEPPVTKPKMRRTHRLLLSDGLERLDLSHLTYLFLHREAASDPFNHSFKCWDVRRDGVDTLCRSLRQLAQRSPLVEMYLSNIMISPELFRCPYTDDREAAAAAAATWPNLRRLSISASLVAPSGEWYYTGNPEDVDLDPRGREILSMLETVTEESLEAPTSGDEDTESENQAWVTEQASVLTGADPTYEWRTRPDPELFDPLILAMSKSALKMPLLRHLKFEMGMDLGEPVGVTLECIDAGERSALPPDLKDESEDEIKQRRWKIWVGIAATWDVPSEIEKCWHDWAGDGGSIVRGVWPAF